MLEKLGCHELTKIEANLWPQQLTYPLCKSFAKI